MKNIYVSHRSVPARPRSERLKEIFFSNLKRSKVILKNGIIKNNLTYEDYCDLYQDKDNIEKFEYDGKEISDFNIFDKEVRKEKNIKEEREAKLKQINKNKEN
jgi:hypothetical protein